jgi:Uma2 family endonuclease
MAKAALPRRWTVEDFLAFEAEEEPCELVGSVVRIMTGQSAAHSAIKGNIALALRDQMPAPCQAYVTDPRVVTETAVMYPDVQVVCRQLDPDDDRVTDPMVVFEVLSPSTQRHDRIDKWREYQAIESLQHFVLVEQPERRVEVFSRTGSGWHLVIVEPPADAVHLQELGVRLSLDEIYRNSGR